jgi:hypothetical protein
MIADGVCESWATCKDLSLMGWTAIAPCSSACPAAVLGPLITSNIESIGDAPITVNPFVNPARGDINDG